MDYEDTAAHTKTGAQIRVTTKDEQYVGILLGADDAYLHLRVTHRREYVMPTVSPESEEGLRRILLGQPLWMLLLKAAKAYRRIPPTLDREALVEALVEARIHAALGQHGPVMDYVAEPVPVDTALSHMDIDRFEALKDVVAGQVLRGLDFKTDVPYNEGHGEAKDEDSGS